MSVIDPTRKGFDCNALIARHTDPEDCTNGFILEPRRLVLGWTAEKIKLPHTAKIGARVEGKSALARIGVGIHVTAPTVHPGFGYKPTQPRYPGSPLRLEIWNIGPLRARLTKGMPICQLMFEEAPGIPAAARGSVGRPHAPPPRQPTDQGRDQTRPARNLGRAQSPRARAGGRNDLTSCRSVVLWLCGRYNKNPFGGRTLDTAQQRRVPPP